MYIYKKKNEAVIGNIPRFSTNKKLFDMVKITNQSPNFKKIRAKNVCHY